MQYISLPYSEFDIMNKFKHFEVVSPDEASRYEALYGFGGDFI